MADFSREITTGGAGWNNILALAKAQGYTGGAGCTFLTVEELVGAAVRVKMGHSSATVAPVSATDGKPVSNAAETYQNCDIGVAWIYTPGANTFNISFHSPIDF
jgi:hypothetical protein